MKKVHHKVESEHHSDPGRHERIAPEVHIEAHGIADRAYPRERCGDALIADLFDLVPQKAEPVGKKDLHAESQYEEEQAVAERLRRNRPLALFKPYVVPPHDRSLRHLREHGKIDHRIDDIRPPCDLAPEQVGLVRDHLEQVEAESQGKDDLIG